MKLSKVLFVGDMKLSAPAEARTYDFHNLYVPLQQVIPNVVAFDFREVMTTVGRNQMNRELVECVRREKFDAAVVVPQRDEFDPDAMRALTESTTTIGYFFDDMWRVEYSTSWARIFSFVTTSDVNGVARFQEHGCNNAVYSPFGVNEEIFRPVRSSHRYAVSFVGQHHPYRAWLLQMLSRAGIGVNVWGVGWPAGPVSYEEMVEIFSASKINLNLSNSVNWDVRYLTTIRRSPANTLKAWRDVYGGTFRTDSKIHEQVKGRHYEIAACEAFQLSYFVEGLERQYAIGSEIAIFDRPDDLVRKVEFYLRHDATREEMSRAAYKRTLRDHTMRSRFEHLFANVVSTDRARRE